VVRKPDYLETFAFAIRLYGEDSSGNQSGSKADKPDGKSESVRRAAGCLGIPQAASCDANEKRVLGKVMPDDKKIKDTAPKKIIAENKAAEGTTKAEAVPKTESKVDAVPKKQGMGEGQKPVSQAYKDNWNTIFAKKKK
jgi:hypothetical protein